MSEVRDEHGHRAWQRLSVQGVGQPIRRSRSCWTDGRTGRGATIGRLEAPHLRRPPPCLPGSAVAPRRSAPIREEPEASPPESPAESPRASRSRPQPPRNGRARARKPRTWRRAHNPRRRSGRTRPRPKATPRKSWIIPMSRTKCWLKKPVSVTPGTSSYQARGAMSMKRPFADRNYPVEGHHGDDRRRGDPVGRQDGLAHEEFFHRRLSLKGAGHHAAGNSAEQAGSAGKREEFFKPKAWSTIGPAGVHSR
ncbi:hypothetical protein BIWAKO_05791 [Bosea sp. BIWAKO-01]|nr:hypothetical protein BIWAKO_05791 [Bosea sp. BIWAKO-01]